MDENTQGPSSPEDVAYFVDKLRSVTAGPGKAGDRARDIGVDPDGTVTLIFDWGASGPDPKDLLEVEVFFDVVEVRPDGAVQWHKTAIVVNYDDWVSSRDVHVFDESPTELDKAESTQRARGLIAGDCSLTYPGDDITSLPYEFTGAELRGLADVATRPSLNLSSSIYAFTQINNDDMPINSGFAKAQEQKAARDRAVVLASDVDSGRVSPPGATDQPTEGHSAAEASAGRTGPAGGSVNPAGLLYLTTPTAFEPVPPVPGSVRASRGITGQPGVPVP